MVLLDDMNHYYRYINVKFLNLPITSVRQKQNKTNGVQRVPGHDGECLPVSPQPSRGTFHDPSFWRPL